MRRRDLLLSSIALASRGGARPVTANWPSFRGAFASGVADGFPTPVNWSLEKNVRWRVPVPGLGHSSPIIWGDRIFLATAISASGSAPLKLGLYGDRDAADDNGEQQWKILCFDRRTGKPLWERTARKDKPRAQRHMKATHANTTLATDGEALVAFFGSEGLHCYDLAGKLLWSKDLGVINVSKYGVGWGYASSPAIYQDRVVVQVDAPESAYIAAFHVRDGRELWRTQRKEVCERCWATPFIYDDGGPRKQVVANGWPYAVSYDFATGKEIWRLKSGGDNPIPTPFRAHGFIYVANGHGGQAPIFAVKPDAAGDISLPDGERSNRHIAWCDRQNGAYIQTPLAYRDWIFSGTNNGVLKCYDALSGKLHYQQRLGDGLTGFSSSPVAADGKIYTASEDGDVYVIAAGPKYELLAKNPLGESVMATPAISDGVLYYRTRSHLLAI